MSPEKDALLGSFINFLATYGKFPDLYKTSLMVKSFKKITPFHISIDKRFTEDDKEHLDSLFSVAKVYSTKINMLVAEHDNELTAIVFDPVDGYVDRLIPITPTFIINEYNNREVNVSLKPQTNTIH